MRDGFQARYGGNLLFTQIELSGRFSWHDARVNSSLFAYGDDGESRRERMVGCVRAFYHSRRNWKTFLRVSFSAPSRCTGWS